MRARRILPLAILGLGAVATVGAGMACGGSDDVTPPKGDASASDAVAMGDAAPDAQASLGSCGVWLSTNVVSGINRTNDLAVSANDVFVVGRFEKEADFGLGAVTPSGKSDGFVVKLAASDLKVAWVVASQLPGSEEWSAVTIAPNGDVFVGGVEADVDASASSRAFVARLAAADGSTLWKKTFAIKESAGVERLRVLANGDLFALGTFQTQADIDGTVLTNNGQNPDLWYARLSPTSGAATWAKKIGATGYDGENDVALEPGGDVIIVGPQRSNGSLTPGMRYTRVAAADGSVVFDRAYAVGSTFNVSVSPTGNAFVAGSAEGNVDLGAGSLDAGAYSRMTAAYTTVADAGLVWTALEPDTKTQRPFLNGAIVNDTFLACTASLACSAHALADGTPRSFAPWGTFTDAARRMVAANGHSYAAGMTQSSFTFGGQTYANTGPGGTRPFVVCASY